MGLEPEDLPLSIFADSDDDEGRCRSDGISVPNLRLHRVGEQKRMFLLKRPSGPGLYLLVRGFSVRLHTVCLLNSRPQSFVVIFFTRRACAP